MLGKEFKTNLGAADCIGGRLSRSTEGEEEAMGMQEALIDIWDCQLTWESQWEEVEPTKTHVFVAGEAPFLEEIAMDRIRRCKIPTFQRFFLSRGDVFSGFQMGEKDILADLDEGHRLEIVGQIVEEKLFFLFRFKEKWMCEFLGASVLANCLKHAGLYRVGTLYLIASKLGAGNFLPTLARELACRGIEYGALCGPEGFVHSHQNSVMTPPRKQKLRMICAAKTPSAPSIEKQKTVSNLVPMLRQGGPDFAYEVIVQIGDDLAVVEAAGILVGSSPFRSCWIKWCPVRGDWKVLYGEPRFLQLSTRWVVVAQTETRVQIEPVDLFGGLEVRAFAIRFLRLLHAFEAWQEVHGKLSHLLLVGANLFKLNEETGFALKLSQEFAVLGHRIQIRVRSFVHQKDIIGRLHAGQLTNKNPFLEWTLDSPLWERDLNWNMGRLTAIDASVHEPESPFRRPLELPFSSWQSSLKATDLSWVSESVVAIHWRERIHQALAEIYQETSYSSNLVPIIEAAALREESSLLWMDVSNGGVLQMGACLACLREFENYFQKLSKDLFEAFLVDGDFHLQRRTGVSLQVHERALQAAFTIFFLVRSEKNFSDYFEKGLAVRLCSEFLKNLGEKTSDRQGILTRAWRGVSKDYAHAWLSVDCQERAILGALMDDADEYETARAYQFSALCIQTSPPILCWKDFSNPVSPVKNLLGNACENLSGRNTAQDSQWKSDEVEEYFEKIDAARKNPVGTLQNIPEGIFWSPPPFAVIVEVDLRTPWICFDTHYLYRSAHMGKEMEPEGGGMPFIQVDHAAQLPCPMWSRAFSLRLWGILGGTSREALPMRPDIVILPTFPVACVSYEWGPCNSEPNFLPDGALRKVVKTGCFHPLYREFEDWHVIQKLHFDFFLTDIEIFLAESTKLLIFPNSELSSHVRYRIQGAGGAYRCLVRRGFVAEICCDVSSESWFFEVADDVELQIKEEGGGRCVVEGDQVSIRFAGALPKISICNNKKVALATLSVSSSHLLKGSSKGMEESPKGIRSTGSFQLPSREMVVAATSASSHNLPGVFLGVFGDLHVRFDTTYQLLRTFCSKSLKPRGPLKTIYAQPADRFDRVGVHDGCCYAVEYLLSSNRCPLEFTYRLSSFGWALAIISTDLTSFFTELKAARRIKCPLDEFLLKWLDAEILGVEEREEGILPCLAEVVLICPKTKSFSSLWVRTVDNAVIWQGKCTSPLVGHSQMALTTLEGEEERFLFQREGKMFFKNGWDTWMFPIHEEAKVKHSVQDGRWIVSAQNVYSLTTIPLQIGWKIAGPISENGCMNLLLQMGDKLHHPLLGLVMEPSLLSSRKTAFIDPIEKVVFCSSLQEEEQEGWFLGRESYGGCACWWLPQKQWVLCSSPLSLSNVSVGGGKVNSSDEVLVRPPLVGAITAAGITDGFLHIRTGTGDIYRRLSEDSWGIIQVSCAGKSEGEIFCEIANAVSQKDLSVSVLPLEFVDRYGIRRVGWFMRRTTQIVKAPIEAGSKAVILGCSADRENYYVYGENRIFKSNGSTWCCQGKTLFALRKNGSLFLVVDHIADPPILDAQNLILVSLSQCRRWKLGEGLHAYQLIVVESGSGSTISGIIDLRPLALQDCICWIEGEDVVIAELASGHLLVIRNGESVVPAGHFFGGVQLRFAELENCLSLRDFLKDRGR